MGRLSDKLSRASDAMARFELDTEKKVDDLIARVDKAAERRDDAFMRKHVALDRHMTDIAEFEKDLEAFDGSNGGPLDDGADTSKTEPPASWQPKA